MEKSGRGAGLEKGEWLEDEEEEEEEHAGNCLVPWRK